jgi:hypothetical protein
MGRRKFTVNKLARAEKGYALIAVLILLLLGSLLIPPLLGYMATGLKTGLVYEKKSKELYGADAGIEAGLWRIKYNYWGSELHNRNYDIYDFSTDWSYQTEPVNGIAANITIQNVWIPYHPERELMPPAEPADARTKIESKKLMVFGVASANPGDNTFTIKVFFTPATSEEDELIVKSLGVWLPHGFSYIDGSGSLEQLYSWHPAYSLPDKSGHAGGQAIVWSFASANFALFPTFNPGPPQGVEVSFKYSADVSGAKPTGIAWIETSGAVSDILPVTWDVDTRIYKITSRADNTEIEAYSAKSELRKLSAAIAGDYKAIGNSNLTGTTIRNTWVYEDGVRKSSTTLSTIPNGSPEEDIGDVIAAYLYWSGSFQSDFTTPIWVPDTCSNLNNWYNSNPNSVWKAVSYSGDYRLRGQYTGSSQQARYLEMKNPVILNGYTPGQVVVEWRQRTPGSSYPSNYLEPDDGLTFELSSNSGTTWSNPITAFYDDIYLLDYDEAYFYYVLPAEYLTANFKLRFHLESCSGSDDYVYIDDIAVARITATADTGIKFWINDIQYYLDENGNPHQGSQELTATRSSVVAFEKPDEYAYGSFRDVTKLVREYAEVVENEYGLEYHTGNAKYSVGDVQADTGEYRSYAGWSLIIIYSSPATAGHYLYFYDTLALNSGYTDLDFDHNGQPGGDITGFVVPKPIPSETTAATLTCFVGEGDNAYTGDFLAFNAPEEYRSNPSTIPYMYKLWDGTSPENKNNVWNSKSIGMSQPGVDIDTFTITWANCLLEEGDITAHIDLYTEQDNWMLIYMVLSVRSETITSGTTHYVIRGG